MIETNVMLNAAGILDMVAGALLMLFSFGGCMNVINAGKASDAWMLAMVIPGCLALIGGLYARMHRNWGLALVGSICAIPAVLGIVSTIFVIMAKGEYKSKPGQ